MNWEPSARFAEWPGCLLCGHYQHGRCIAYPKAIPLPIISGAVGHMVPRLGQVGATVFEPIDPAVGRTEHLRVPLSAAPGASQH